MEYYLLSNIERRVFIDNRIHDGCFVQRVISADSWMDARDQVDADEFVPIPGYGYFIDFFQSNRSYS